MSMKSKVYNLNCQNCNVQISSRGMRIHLVSNPSVKGYSSDYGSLRTFQLCNCQIQDLSCSSCKQVVGYHVVLPCTDCSKFNNAQYYLFLNAIGEETDKLWKDLPPILKEQQIQEFQYSQQFICPICYQIMVKPTIIICGHTFCKRCIQRNVDLNASCPLDKKEMSRAGPFIPNRLIQTLIETYPQRQIKSHQ